jgi:hypothetical protein
MTEMNRKLMIEERRTMLAGKTVTERGAAGQLKDAAAAAATDRLLAPIRAVHGPEGAPDLNVLLARLDERAQAGDRDGFHETIKEISRKGQLTGDRTLDRFLQLASRLVGTVQVEGARTVRLSGLIEAMPVGTRFRVLLMLASDAATMLNEPYRPGALREHLRRTVTELADG